MSGAAARKSPAPSAMGRHHGLRSETGYVRKANEDQLGFRRIAAGEIYVVSDGMGGYRGGELAARETVKSLLETLGKARRSEDMPGLMGEAFRAANKAVFDKRRPEDPETREMGATAVAVFIAGSKAMVGHVGDSRAYRWSEGSGLKALTKDHSRVQQMIDDKIISVEEAARHPDASVLARAIGHQATVEADISSWISLRPGERLMLCSDGLSGYASDAEIDVTLRQAEDPQSQTDKLIELALKKGGEDNVTVQVVKVSGGGASMSQRLFSPTSLFVVFTAAFLSLVWWMGGVQSRTEGALSRLEQSIKAAPAPSGPLDSQAAAQIKALESQVALLKQQVDDLAVVVAKAPERPGAAPKPAAEKPVTAPTKGTKGATVAAKPGEAKASDAKAKEKKSDDASGEGQSPGGGNAGQANGAARSGGNADPAAAAAGNAASAGGGL